MTDFVRLKQAGRAPQEATSELQLQAERMESDVLVRGQQLQEVNQQLRRANEEVTRLYEKTKELDVLKSQFFASLSHELRTPLALILGPTQRILASPETDEAVRRDLEVVARNGRTLQHHVDGLLDVAKLEAGRMNLDYAEMDLARLVRFVASHFDALASERSVTFALETPEILWAEVDPDKLQRILLNLLSNAFKFTPAGGRVRSSVRETNDERVIIEVADSGPGIPVDKRGAVFERFFQLEGGDTRRFGGTGLGLSIARHFAALHHGSISIGEAAEGGALFTVEVPRKARPGTPVRRGAAAMPEVRARDEVHQAVEELRGPPATPALVGGAKEGPLVLVVEDNPEMNRFIAESLMDRYRVATAFDGAEGLDKALALKPDLVVADIMMPVMSGDELVDALRKKMDPASMPIVLVTSKADDELRVSLLRDGAQDYLTKPFPVEELRARVGNLLAAKLARDAILASEARLRLSEARFSGIVSISVDAIVSIDGAQRITMFNEGAVSVFGYSKAEIIGSPLDVLIPERFRLSHRQHVKSFAEGPQTARRMGTRSAEIRGLRKNGEEFPADASISKLEVGGESLLIVSMRDISEQKHREHEQRLLAEAGKILVSAGADYQRLLTDIADVVVRDIADWCIVDIVQNGDARRLRVVHSDPAKAATCDALERFPLERRGPSLVGEVLDTQRPSLVSDVPPEYLESIAQSEEHLRLLRALDPRSFVVVPLIARGQTLGTLALGASRASRRYGPQDVSEAERLASYLALAVDNARAHEALERAVQARDEVLGIVAHDLRSPLSSILLQLRVQARGGAEIERRDQEPSARIYRAAMRMNRLIQDLLDVTSLEGGSASRSPRSPFRRRAPSRKRSSSTGRRSHNPTAA